MDGRVVEVGLLRVLWSLEDQESQTLDTELFILLEFGFTLFPFSPCPDSSFWDYKNIYTFLIL